MKTSRTRAAGQQAGRQAPARSTSALAPKTRAKTLPQRPPALPALLAQLDQIAADVEARTDDRDAAAVAVAVRLVVTLARQQGPEGARLTPTRTASAAGLCWRSGGSQEGEHIEAPPSSPAPSPAQVTLIGAMLGILHHLADAQDAARNIEGTLTCGVDLATNANDLRRCIHSLSLDLELLGFEAEACCRELTGEEGPRSLLCHAIDLARLDGVFSRRSPQGQRQAVAVDEHVAKRAAEHFARSA